MAPPPAPIQKESVTPTSQNPIRREGDTGLGTPEFKPENARTLSEDETQAHFRAVEDQMRQKASELLADLEEEQGWKLPRALRNVISALLIVMAALMGMFITTQTVQFFADIHSMPLWSRWLSSAAMILFGGILFLVFAGLIWGLFRLQRTPRLHLKAMKTLSERRQLQRFAVQKQSEARVRLEHYLRNYPLTEKEPGFLTALGIKDGELASLKTVRERLLDRSRPMGASDWLDDFQKGFQNILDDLAQRRVRQYARRIGIGTAASPIAFVDQMIVLYGCTAMVKDMFAIYHLRPAFGQTVLTLARSVVHTYLSGMFGDLAETAMDGMDGLEDIAGGGLGFLTGTVGKAVSAKAAEASLNAMLILRLGKRTIRILQPVVRERK